MNNKVAQLQAQKSSGFSLHPENMEQAMKIATMLAKSEMVPKQYKTKPEDTLVAMMMGSELGLNPIQALQNIAVINGRPSIYGDALVALVQSHSAFGGVEETFDEQSMTATCITWRKGGAKHKQTFSQNDAVKAGLWDKAGPWKQYPKRMLQMRARGFSLRDSFADALAGLITYEEAQDMPVIEAQEIDITPQPLAIAYYPAEDFSKNFKAWESAILAGKNTPESVIAKVQSKGVLTQEQLDKINSCKPKDGVEDANT